MSWDPIELFERILRDIRRRIAETENVMRELTEGLWSIEPPRYPSHYDRIVSMLRDGATEPLASIYDEGDEVVIVVSMPGARRESIDVKVFEDKVEISARMDTGKVVKAYRTVAKYTRIERYVGTYKLPEPVDPATARYTVKGDMLVIRVKKRWS